MKKTSQQTYHHGKLELEQNIEYHYSAFRANICLSGHKN